MRHIGLLQTCLSILGLVGHPKPRHQCLRIAIITLNVIYTAYISVYLLFIPKCFIERWRQSHYVYDGFHVMFLYLWCCRNARLFRDDVSVASSHFNKHLCVIFTLAALVLWRTYDLAEGGSIGLEFNSIHWTYLLYFGEFFGYSILLRLQMTSIYLFICVRMRHAANSILAPEIGSKRSPAAACHRAIRICSAVDSDLAGIVRVIHLEYCLRLLTEIPVIAVSIFEEFEAYITALGLLNLYTFLLVVDSGNTLRRAVTTIRKSVRKNTNLDQKAVHVFLGDDYGVHLAAANVLSWKSCCSFFGMTWPFSFMIYEYSARLYLHNTDLCQYGAPSTAL